MSQPVRISASIFLYLGCCFESDVVDTVVGEAVVAVDVVSTVVGEAVVAVDVVDTVVVEAVLIAVDVVDTIVVVLVAADVALIKFNFGFS